MNKSMIGADDISKAIELIRTDAENLLNRSDTKTYRTWPLHEDFVHELVLPILGNRMNSNQFRWDKFTVEDARFIAGYAALILAMKMSEGAS